MNVAELRKILEGLDDNMEVHFEYNYGDHWRTTVAPSISEVRVGSVEWSDYHRMHKSVELSWDETNSDPAVQEVVLIS